MMEKLKELLGIAEQAHDLATEIENAEKPSSLERDVAIRTKVLLSTAQRALQHRLDEAAAAQKQTEELKKLAEASAA